MFGWGLGKSWGLGRVVARSPFRIAKRGGQEFLAASGASGEFYLGLFMWAAYSVGALWLSIQLKRFGFLAPAQWLLAVAGVLGLSSLWGFFLTRKWRMRHRNLEWMQRVERIPGEVAKQVQQAVSAAKTEREGGGVDVLAMFRRPKTAGVEEDARRLAGDQAAQVQQWTEGDMPEWMRRMGGPKPPRRWWRRG
jgi:hypothetical protein